METLEEVKRELRKVLSLNPLDRSMDSSTMFVPSVVHGVKLRMGSKYDTYLRMYQVAAVASIMYKNVHVR